MRVPGTLTIQEALKLGLPIALYCSTDDVSVEDGVVTLNCGGEKIVVQLSTLCYADGPHGLLTKDDIEKVRRDHQEQDRVL